MPVVVVVVAAAAVVVVRARTTLSALWCADLDSCRRAAWHCVSSHNHGAEAETEAVAAATAVEEAAVGVPRRGARVQGRRRSTLTLLGPLHARGSWGASRRAMTTRMW